MGVKAQCYISQRIEKEVDLCIFSQYEIKYNMCEFEQKYKRVQNNIFQLILQDLFYFGLFHLL